MSCDWLVRWPTRPAAIAAFRRVQGWAVIATCMPQTTPTLRLHAVLPSQEGLEALEAQRQRVRAVKAQVGAARSCLKATRVALSQWCMVVCMAQRQRVRAVRAQVGGWTGMPRAAGFAARLQRQLVHGTSCAAAVLGQLVSGHSARRLCRDMLRCLTHLYKY